MECLHFNTAFLARKGPLGGGGGVHHVEVDVGVVGHREGGGALADQVPQHAGGHLGADQGPGAAGEDLRRDYQEVLCPRVAQKVQAKPPAAAPQLGLLQVISRDQPVSVPDLANPRKAVIGRHGKH